jgi:hypothetical protein
MCQLPGWFSLGEHQRNTAALIKMALADFTTAQQKHVYNIEIYTAQNNKGNT